MYQNTQGPAPVPVTVGPFLQQFVPMITQVTVNELASKAGNNPIRGAFNQHCQQNPQFFGSLVQMVADHADMVVAGAGGQANIQEQIMRSAADICTLQASVFAFRNQQMFPGVDPNTASGIANQVGIWENVARQLAQFTEHRARVMQGAHMQQNHQQWGHVQQGNPANRTYGGHMQQSNAGGYGTGPFVPAGWNSQPVPAPNPMTAGIGNSMAAGFSTAPQTFSLTGDEIAPSPLTQTASISEISAAPNQGVKVLTESQVRPSNNGRANTMKTTFPVMRPLVAAAATPMNPAPAAQTTPAPIDVNRGWDQVEMNEGLIRPAFMATDWRRTFSLKAPYGTIFQPSTDLLMLFRDKEGNVGEYLKKWDETMDYLKQELNPELRAKMLDKHRKESGLVWSQMRDVKFAISYPMAVANPDLILNAESREEFLNQEDLTICPDFAFSRTLEDGINVVRMDQGYKQYKALSNSVYEYYIDLVRPVLAPLGDLAMVEALSKEFSLPVLHKHMCDYTGVLSADVMRVLDVRIADEISFHLSNSLGLRGWSITSFLADFDELKQLIYDRYGEELWLEFSGLTDRIIRNALAVKTGEALEEFLKYEGRTLEDDEDLIVFTDKVSVTELGIDAEALSLTFDQGGLLRSDAYPESYGALASMLDRLGMAKNAPNFARHYLRTKDNSLFVVMRPYLGIADAGVLVYPVK